jgi:S1-C subfamily serine protease
MFCAGLVMGSRLHRPGALNSELVGRLNQLDAELKQLQNRELSASEIVAANRDSICFIVSSYTLADSWAPGSAPVRYRLLATGFLVRGNKVVSNRHVLEGWFGDPHAETAIRLGAVASRGKILAYFPTLKQPLELSHVVASRAADLAVAQVELPSGVAIPPLRLASQTSVTGEAVLVMGYPLGVTTMLAKTAAVPYQVSALRQDEQEVDHLAQFKLIRPTATQGHLADMSGTTLMYDATTAHGSSGGPVFNMRGEVIGVNAALINGFTGTSLGVSTAALLPLLNSVETQHAASPHVGSK